MTTPRRIGAALLGLLVTSGLGATVGTGPATAVPVDASQPWPAATTLGTATDIETPHVLGRYADSDSGDADRAVWVARDAGRSAVRIADGPPLRQKRARDLSVGSTSVGPFDTGSGLMAWFDTGRHVLEVVGIGASGGQGTSYGVISGPAKVPGTQGMPDPTEVTVAEGRSDSWLSAVLWTNRQPDGKLRTTLALVSFDGISGTFAYGPFQDVAGPADSIDQVRAYWAGSRLLVAYRSTAADGTQTLRLRTGAASDVTQGVAWGDDVPFCDVDCADPTFASSGVTQVLYREAGILKSRLLAPSPAAPTVLGPAPSSYAVHNAVVEYLPSGTTRSTGLAVATADSSGVRVWRANGGGVFGLGQQVSTAPATGVAISARRGDDLLLWRQGDAVVSTRGRGDRWTRPALVSGSDRAVDAGFSAAGSLPVIWYVDTVPGGERLRTSSLDDDGPVTTWDGIRRDRHHPRQLRFGFRAEDPSGLRITTVQVRSGPPGHLGPWGVFERLTHRGQRVVDRSLALKGRVGIRYCARARAVDTVGNVGAWGRKPSDDGAIGFKTCITVKS